MIKWITDSVRYFIDYKHRLIVFGRGGIPNYAPSYNLTEGAPWKYEYFTEVIITGGIDYIGAYTFSGNLSIEKIRISKTVEDIHPRAFRKEDLSKIVISRPAFSEAKLKMTEAGIYRTLTDELLIGRNQRHVKIPEGTKLIGIEAFAECQDLITVECPDSLEIICVGAFENCRNLREIYRIPEKAKIGKRVLKGTSKVSCFYEKNFPKNRIEDADAICVMTDYGSAKLKDGVFIFYASGNERNIDPTELYRCRDLIDLKGGDRFIIGLRSNGEVVLADLDTPEDPVEMYLRYGSIERLEGWQNIRQIEADGEIVAGRSSDGKVFSNIAEDENEPLPGMNEIISVKIKSGMIWGMKENGECILYV